MLNNWKDSIEDPWSSVCGLQRANNRKTNAVAAVYILGTAAANIYLDPATLAVPQRQPHEFGNGDVMELGNGFTVCMGVVVRVEASSGHLARAA